MYKVTGTSKQISQLFGLLASLVTASALLWPLAAQGWSRRCLGKDYTESTHCQWFV